MTDVMVAAGPRVPALLSGGAGWEPPHGSNAVACVGMGREEPATSRTLDLSEPSQGVGHQASSVVTGTLEDLDAVGVGLVFLLAAVGALDQSTGDWCERPR